MNETYSTYFGINKAILPDMALLHIFLVYFTNSTNNQVDIEQLINRSSGNLENNNLIICKETDPIVREKLYANMARWIRDYSFAFDQKGCQPIPYHKNLIYNDKKGHSQVLFRMLYPDKTSFSRYYTSDQQNLLAYLYEDQSGAYSAIVQMLYKIISSSETDFQSRTQIHKIDELSHQTTISDFGNFKKVSNNFRVDFTNHVTSSIFKSYDSFRRINSLMLLLNFYVTLYTIYRSMEENEVIIFAKGANEVITTDGTLHSTVLGCFSDIRERVFQLSEGFYEKIIRDFLNEPSNKTLSMRTANIKNEDGENALTIEIDNERGWAELRSQMVSSRLPKVLDEIIIDYLDLEDQSKRVTFNDLAKAFVDYSKKRASSVRKVSSIFSSQGQQAKFVFPKNSNHKYYAMSSELTELLLKLCLSEKKTGFLTLDVFMAWLEDKYGIYLAYSEHLSAFLKSRSIRVPSFSEFEQNVQAFITTLESISAIQKMSDKSFIVHDSGKVGGFSW